MQQLNMATIAKVAGGMTVEKYDESTQELFNNVRTNLHKSLERLAKLEATVAEGYAGISRPMPVQDQL